MHFQCIDALLWGSIGVLVGGCDEVVQNHVLVDVVDFAGQLGGFIHVA